MFIRKLEALNYIDYEKINENDEQHLKKLVVWLEDQKIRQYKIEDRKDLQNLDSDQWQTVFEKYLGDVGCPELETQLDKVEWLIGLAIRLEFEDHRETYKLIKSNKSKSKNKAAPNIKSSNPLDNLDFQSTAFKNGINTLAKLLNIPQHPNHLVTLEACSKLVCKRLNSKSIQNPNSVIVRGQPFPIFETNTGFNMNDPVLNNAVKVLNLLYIHDLRDLQTKMNEAIVSVQNITFNPRTETKWK